MKKILTLTAVATLIISCGNKDSLAEKKSKLDKLKTEMKNLEDEIAKLDTTKKQDVSKLVSTTTIAAADFKHYIELQGKVDAHNISIVTPRLAPGQVKQIFIQKGQQVSKGQTLLKLDDAIIRQSIIAAKQSLETIKTQLTLAKDLFNRQNNLWKQGIGTEVQVISAKTQVETLEKQLAAGNENVKTAQEQLATTIVVADVDGVVDELNVRVGETFMGYIGQSPQIKIVNTSSLKVVTQVPENYAAKVKSGSKLLVVLPEINKTYTASISFLSKTINANDRSFTAEAKLPYDAILRPNQNAQVKIEDYAAPNAIAIPVNTVQTDDKGKYVYIAIQQGTKLIAHKKAITVGELSGQMIEVKSGLSIDDKLITEGFQNLYENQNIKLSN